MTSTVAEGQTSSYVITERDLAREFQCTVVTLRRKRNSGVIPRHTYAKVGRAVVYYRNNIAEIFDRIACEGID